MAPRLDTYTIRMKNLHQRYGLPKTIMQLFMALDDHRRGFKDPDTLGRALRMSPHMRMVCTDTISSLVEAMQKDPQPECISECTELIAACTDMLALANEPKQKQCFPFMQLPPEIRRRVYKFYFNSLFARELPGRAAIIANFRSACACPPHETQRTRTAPRIKMPLCHTSRLIKDEVLAAWFESQVFQFACCCELDQHLRKNSILRNNLKSIKIHWTGPKASDAFRRLKQVSTLKNLTIVVSKSTTNWPSEREQLFLRYFTPRWPRRLCDASGFEELLLLRGIEQVEVEHVSRIHAARRSNEERMGLQCMLQAKVTRDEDREEDANF